MDFKDLFDTFFWRKKVKMQPENSENVNVTLNANSDINEANIDKQAKFVWCLIGNIIGTNSLYTNQEIKHGTKHFSQNTKVYCFPVLWGDGYENIKVVGRHRKKSRNICIIMPSKHIVNWRLQKIYNPHIIDVMQSQNGWTNSDNDKQKILEMLKYLPIRAIE
jgi:hypothetical protein